VDHKENVHFRKSMCGYKGMSASILVAINIEGCNGIGCTFQTMLREILH